MFESFFPALRARELEPRGRDLFSLMENVLNKGWDFPYAMSYPSVDVSETDSEVVVKAELPGMEVRDLEVSVSNNVLFIKGEKKQESEEKDKNTIRRERYFGQFSRSIPLPSQCSEQDVKARFKDGILAIQIPKDESARSKRINIES